jgi:hypothetical protein
MSTATIRRAGVRAAAMTERPTAPAPDTTTVLPGRGRSTFHTAPTPVCTPQPSGAIVSSGAEGSTLTTLRSSATASREKEDWPKKCPPSASPPRVMVAEPSRRDPPIRLSGSQVAQ